MTAAPGPWRVLVVDLENPPPAVDGVRPAGGRYEHALLYLTRGGALVGEIEVDLDSCVDLASVMGAHPVTQQPSPAPVPDDDLPFTSVVIATTMSREAELDRCLDALLRLDYPRYEVILVDNRPSRSAERALLHARLCRDPRVRLVVEPRRGISVARNHGARVAHGEIVAFTDDDVVVQPGWLRAIGLRFAAEPGTDCVTGPVLPAELETAPQVWFERSRSKLPNRYVPTTFRGSTQGGGLGRRAFEVVSLTPGQPDQREFVYRAGTFGMGANLSIRRSAFARLGGFCEALGTGTPAAGGEDIEALARLLHRGGQITYDPAAVVRHRHRGDLTSAKTQMHGYGRGLTAAMTALVVTNPRHLVGLAHTARTASRVFAAKSAGRRTLAYPQELARRERTGLVVGPLAYLWGRLRRPRRAAAWSLVRESREGVAGRA